MLLKIQEILRGILKEWIAFLLNILYHEQLMFGCQRNIPNQKNTMFCICMMGKCYLISTKTWNKQEWKVDEVASQLMKENKVTDFIVVAIWNIPNLRHMDLYPKKPYESLSKEFKEKIQIEAKKSQFSFDDSKINSDNYLKFIVEELKPYIDKKYSVFTNGKSHSHYGFKYGRINFDVCLV
jgi:hypothetical protein